jgi:hypothetical protein
VPPDLDMYGLTKRRNAATIGRFLDEYVDRTASEDRGDEELMLEPLLPTQDGTDFDAVEWEPALTLSHIIERGLAFPRRAFTVYLTPKQKDLTSVTLSFTSDDQLVLGVSFDDAGAKPENEGRAREILTQLMEGYGCHCGLIQVYDPPPRNETEFRARAPHTLFFSPSFEEPPA